jgi:hypothetical protein
MDLDTIQTNWLDSGQRHEDPAWDFHNVFRMIPTGAYPPVRILFVQPKTHSLQNQPMVS